MAAPEPQRASPDGVIAPGYPVLRGPVDTARRNQRPNGGARRRSNGSLRACLLALNHGHVSLYLAETYTTVLSGHNDRSEAPLKLHEGSRKSFAIAWLASTFSDCSFIAARKCNPQ